MEAVVRRVVVAAAAAVVAAAEGRQTSGLRAPLQACACKSEWGFPLQNGKT